jgi:alanyl-tRNA synthetase
MLSRDIRRAFLDFFASKGHHVAKSASIVPNDPTLLFVNAGMAPFKDLFTGKETRAYKRATSSQKCIRISGKHNDLENVGRTARHHTFYEMLGNFSFGDYFKKDAIAYAWELLGQLGVEKDRLIITVFAGDEGYGVGADDEARAIWQEVSGLAPERIVGMGKEDNFWQMGDTGPCGPCSEIHIWQGPIPEGGVPYARFGEEPKETGEGWFEIWNLVFMQFERSKVEGGFEMKPLPAPSIDTGAGLERVACVLQGVLSNYDTDLLKGLVEKAATLAGKTYGATMSPDDVSMRVIADHARTAAFMVAEGIFPDRAGREYVLRRVMRRAIRHGHRLGITRPFLHEVCLLVVETMGDDYPELRDRKDLIASIVEQEEIRFRETIDRGLKILDEEIEKLAGGKVLGGEAAFKLYDTFGFPLDLTEVICEERGLTVDAQGYEKAMEGARARSEGSQLNKDETASQAYRDALALVGEVRFNGYERESDTGRIVALIENGKLVDKVAWEGGEGQLPNVDVVLDATPFYGRGGGQVGDTGVISKLDESGATVGRIHVHDTTKPLSGLVVHHGRLSQGSLAVGDTVELEVDHVRRSATRRNHSATHLLHWALGHVLGEHVEQKGSLVSPDTLRFDFSHGKPLSAGEIERIEDLVNEKILGNAPVMTEVLGIDDARKKGAKAIFEEKYGDVVRVLTMTKDSIELCGGTHARALGDLGLFKIVSESGVAAGVRRVEAATGLNALAFVRDQDKLLREIAQASKQNGPRPRVEAIHALTQRVRDLEKEKLDLTRKIALGGGAGGSGVAEAREVNGVKILAVETEITDASALREMAEQLRDKLVNGVVLIASKGDKAMFVVAVTKGLNDKIKAGDLIRPVAEAVGGKGGGRPDLAQAGGPDVAKLGDAVAVFYERASAAAAG